MAKLVRWIAVIVLTLGLDGAFVSSLATVLMASEVAQPAPAAVRVDQYPRANLPDASGGQTSLASLRGKQATVLVSLSVECPISRGYVPTLNRITEKYAKRGVALVGINPNAGQSLRDIVSNVREYHVDFPMLKDHGGHVAEKLGLEICPEVCVIDPAGEVCYRGRIDDRYARRGTAADQPEVHDLERALDELLSGKPVSQSRTQAIGCPVRRTRTNAKPMGGDAQAVTYTRDISRLLQRHCQECHHEGGIGPFALTTYENAVDWADDIRQFTADGVMPPWKPVDGHGEFKNRRSMSQKEKDQIAAWVSGGCAHGLSADLPPPRTFADGWRLGVPDLVLEPTEEFQLSADGRDVYRCFVMPTNFDHDEYVVAMEVDPGNSRVVHHVIAFLDGSGQARKLDAKEPGPGYTTMQGGPGFFPMGGLGGWAPGNTAGYLPEGMAKVLPRGADVVMHVHYHKSGKPEADRTRLGLYLAKGKVTRAVRALPIMPRGGPYSGMRIPAGDPDYQVQCSFVLPRDLLAVSITPHMHRIGKDMRVTATLPGGALQPLVYVKDWDFNWQEMYQYREPLLLPAGTRIDLTAHYDNSDKNPRNPSTPPRDVGWGEQTTDEMCIAFIEVAPREEARSADDLKPPNRAAAMRALFAGQVAADREHSAETIARWKDRLRRMFDAAPSRPAKSGKEPSS